MTDVASQCRFPLYLTPLETFMRVDDRPAYPMTFVIQMAFSGIVDRPAFEAALEEGLARHPLLAAIVQPAKRNQPCWVLTENSMPPIDWGDESAPIECPGGEGIDITRQPGMRVWVRQGNESTRIVLQFHHANSDGIGVYRFIGDLLACYGRRISPDDDRYEPGPLDPQLLRTRKNGTLNLALDGTAMQVARVAIGDGARMFGKRAVPLHPPAAHKPARDWVAPFPGIESIRFTPDEYKQLRLATVERGVTVNDLLLSELLQAMRDWNEQNSGRRSGRRLSIMMPIDLRGSEHFDMPAANMTGYTFITRKPGDCDKPDELLAGIRNETALIKHERRGTRFVDMLAATLSIRGLLPLVLSSNYCLATAVLSNVGDPSRRWTAKLPRDKGRVVAGNLVMEDIDGVPPLRPKSRAAVSAFTYRRGLTISLRCDPYLFRPEDTRELLTRYADRLRGAAGL